MLETIKDIILEACDTLDEEQITLEARFIEDLNVSSMETLTIISDIEDEFDIKISNKEVRHILTVNDLLELVTRKQDE